MSPNAEASQPKSAVARRMLMHGGVYTVARVTNQALVFVLLPLYVRKLGSEGLGVIEVTNAARNVLAVVFQQGLAMSWYRLRLTQKDPAERRSFEATIIWYLLASSLPLIGMFTWFGEDLAHWFTPGVPFFPIGLLTVVTAATFSLPMLLERHLLAHQKPAQLALQSVVRTLVTLGAIVWFVVGLERGAQGKVEAETIVGLLTGLAVIVWLRPAPPAQVRVPQLRAALAYGLPQVPTGIAMLINDMIDRVLISASLGLAAVGIYSVGYRVASVGTVLMLSVTQAFSPIFMEGMHDAEGKAAAGDATGANAIRADLARAGLAVVVLSASLAQGITATGREIIALVAPAQVSGAWPVLGPVCAGVVAWSCHTLFVQQVFYNIRSARLVAVIAMLGAACNVVANLLLIPRIGIMGAAWATLLSNGLFAVLSRRVGIKYAPVPYAWGKWLRVLLWTAASLVAFHVCDASMISTWTRVATKAAALAISLAMTAWLAGINPTTVRALRARLAA